MGINKYTEQKENWSIFTTERYEERDFFKLLGNDETTKGHAINYTF